ncbi:MAG: sugar-binding domain-containing protein, partial [Thermoguttaceae bacterium]
MRATARVALSVLVLACLPGVPDRSLWAADGAAPLPDGVRAVWDLEHAWRQATATRERVSINGLWRWQPAGEAAAVPESGWGHYKVPGCWPGITDYMQKDCQTVFTHPDWAKTRLGGITSAWYQRRVTVPQEWAGHRIRLEAACVNSFAEVYVDGAKAGEIRFPAGELDLTTVCRPGQTHTLSLRVEAMPLKAVMLSYNDTASARQVKGSVARRGLCGDVYLASIPQGPSVRDVKVETSFRNRTITIDAALADLEDGAQYVLKAQVADGDTTVHELGSSPLDKSQLREGRFRFTGDWLPEKLWDVHTPENMFDLRVELVGADGRVLDAALPERFGFREFWIDGRDFYLNGVRIFLSSVPLDNAQIGAAWSTYDAARESLRRLAGFGINFVYTHNYGCEPGTHLAFEEILRAADDAGMLVSFSQPHFGQYEWKDADAERKNGYARDAEYYVRVAQNHPSVVAYSTSHNGTGYADDMNPQMIDGIQIRRNEWSQRNADRALRAEAILRRLDPSRFVYHHAGGNIGSMHTINFYTNFVPVQEMSDWFEHWASEGVKPLFTCEYCVPMSWDWTMYRGWYNGKREFGSAAVPWEFCVAEWNAQFLGDKAYQVSEAEKRNLRWEARQYETGKTWHRWDYPNEVGSERFVERFPIYARYFADNWPAFRTWGISANSPWDHGQYWTLREGVDKSRQELEVDWQAIQRPGFSPDYIEDRYERIDLAFEPEDWIATEAAEALVRANGPVLGYLAGRREAFTGKDHNFYPGETVEKQL